ncbi:phage tail tape measure protein [Acinetobacter sp. YH16040_T]|uniref:phage tail tape measure protein n=1 Tax=unclassified Acinetobacter TaxID=196816 RepID=UPI0015D1E4F5|nr:MULTISPECIES: phage tail tape measure protein [unclassified Acinetobacter]UUS56256.1 phage tail tape measure protein [Acinetobacter sp. YH16040_T]
MSTKLGTLTLDLVARIGSFVGPIKDAEKQTKQSFESMRKHVNSFGSVAVAGAAAAGAAAFAMAKNYADAAQELRIFSSIANASNQEFQAMAVGAQTMGISQEKLADQLKDFNEKLGEFITIGSGGAVDFFEQIAIKTEGSAEGARKLALEMQNLSGPKALQLYVDKLEEAGVTQQQMSFYLESMASDTTNLIPLLKQGGEGFKFWADAAERAGVIMDESAIAKAAELKVQLGLLDLQVQGATNQFIQGLIPALVSVGDAMSDATVNTNMMADAGGLLGEVFKGVAATGMGVYATIRLLSNSIAGLAYDANVAKKHMEVESGWKKWTGINFFKSAILGTAAARTSENSGIAMAAQDNNKVIEDVANYINRLYSDTASAATKQMAKIQSSQAGVTKGSQEWVKKQNDVAKAANDSNKVLREQNRILEEQQRIIYDYASGPLQKEIELEEEIKRLRKNGMSEYISMAEARFEQEKKLAEMQIGFEVSEHKLTAKRRLEYSFNIRHQEVMADAKLTKEQRDGKIQALNEQYRIESEMLRIAQSKQLLEAKRHWISAADYAKEYYALVREEILNTAEYSPEMKQSLVKEANFNQGLDSNADRENVWGDYKSMMGLDKSPYQEDMDLLAEARAQMLITEEEYQNARLQLQAKSTASYMEGMLGGFASLVDENSKTYAVLFAAQKAFAVAQAMLNIPAAYSKAYDAVVGTPYIGPYIAPAIGAAAAALQVAQAASIRSVNITGMAHDGIDNIPKEGTWLLDGGERVLNPEQNKDLTRYLNDKQTQAAPAQGQQLTIVNQIEQDDLVGNYMRGAAGGQILINQIKANPSDFKAAMGIA